MRYPTAWEQVASQSANLQLYNVDPKSREVADFVAEAEACGRQVLKVILTVCANPDLCLRKTVSLSAIQASGLHLLSHTQKTLRRLAIVPVEGCTISAVS